MTEIDAASRFLSAVEMGLGAWQWGDRVVWGYGKTHTDKEIRETFDAALAQGIRFVDTAEIYGRGYSERLLGKFIRETEQPVLVATKFFPYPWRLTRNSIPRALKGSLERLGLDSVDLYQIHWPTPLMDIEAMAAGLAECVQRGWTRAAGVSNFDERKMIRAYTALARYGVSLASNQVHYSLLRRDVEKNGTLARCKELGVRLIAYSPLEMGLLTGKYSAQNPPAGVRGAQYGETLKRIAPLIQLMQDLAARRGAKTVSQVALNWLICKGALPIPGAKNAAQVEQNAGGAGWRLTEEEVALLDEAADSAAGAQK